MVKIDMTDNRAVSYISLGEACLPLPVFQVGGPDKLRKNQLEKHEIGPNACHTLTGNNL